jgi:hypothetical protein
MFIINNDINDINVIIYTQRERESFGCPPYPPRLNNTRRDEVSLYRRHTFYRRCVRLRCPRLEFGLA